jgi:hypothetical protein
LEPIDTAERQEYSTAVLAALLRNLIVSALSKKHSSPKMLDPLDLLITADRRYEIMFPDDPEIQWGVDVDGKRVRVKEAQDPDQMMKQFAALVNKDYALPKVPIMEEKKDG